MKKKALAIKSTKEYALSNHKYYYVRDSHNRPMVTICIAEFANGKYARGVSCCGHKDRPHKAQGRIIATGRLNHALARKQNTQTVMYHHNMAYLNGILTNDRELFAFIFEPITKGTPAVVLSGIDVALTKFEQRLFTPYEDK